MESSPDDRFIVFLRAPRGAPCQLALAEQAVATCSSYAEARRILKELLYAARECVIRYVGPTGGRD
jgi:hypothetical protein